MDASTLGNWPPGSLGTCNCAGMTPCYIRIQLPGTWLKKMMCPECSTPPHPFKMATLPVSASLVASGHGRSCIWVDAVGNAESFPINIQRGRVAYIQSRPFHTPWVDNLPTQLLRRYLDACITSPKME